MAVRGEYYWVLHSWQIVATAVPAPHGSTHLQRLQLHSGAPGFSASVRLCCTVLCTCLFLAM